LAPYYAALAAAIACGVLGQIVLKHGAVRAAGGGFLGQFLDPVTIAGLGVYFLAALLYILALKRIPLSVANPSVAISYVAVALLAHYLWGEPFGLQQVAALGLITAGILVLNY
jgi:undecaprenyl phosphate-alpha-L-ara4N flippase subunit ArnE